jgi:iron(III) transport system substrate-binding protein
MKRVRRIAAAVGAALAFTGAAHAAESVNVYSYRQPFLINPLFEAFTKETGIPVNVVFAQAGIVKRLQAEGANSPADLVMTVDIGRLTDLVDADLVQPVTAPVLERNIPAQFRHPKGLWYGLTMRARLIYASKERVKPGEITTYEGLADPKWKGRICTRKGDHVYQIGLLASMIAHHGVADAKKWLAGLKENLARKPQGNDRAQVKAIMEGVCDLSIGNNYYMAAMLRDEKQKAWADSAYLVFPNQNGRGTHVNISGMALAKGAPNKEAAVKLMEFLSGETAQKIYAERNDEYPVKDGVPWSDLLESWGRFKADSLALEEIAKNRKAAIRLVNEVGYNN